MPIAATYSRFECSMTQKEHFRNRFHSIATDQQAGYAFRYETGAKYNAFLLHRFDAENIIPKTAFDFRFASEGRGSCQIWNHYDALKTFEHPRTSFSAKFELTRSWDTGAQGRFHAVKSSFQKVSNVFDAILYLKYAGVPGMFDGNSIFLGKIPNSLDAMPGHQNTVTIGRFDTSGSEITSVPMSRQAFVKPGWRILIRNAETNTKRELGFIEQNAVEKSIKDVDLLDGDYEITLLYSSLFWKDAIDRVVRNVTIRSDEEPVLGLPPVLNLVSQVNDGITRISWASNSDDFEDCEFGLWFSENPPVVTFREPDQTVAYTASDVEYGVNITQSVPLWCVVMAVKGNMRGPASEIYLDWSNGLPRRPDDQVAFDVFLDEKLEALKNVSGKVEGVEWDTSEGYW
jgi:hypothetical protein